MIYNNYFQINNNTPLIKIKLANLEIYSKIEFLNPTGSVKDRAASYIIEKALSTNTINQYTTIIESSSGNFGVALAAYCNFKKLKFICVIDPHILPVNEFLIKYMGAQVIKVDEPDCTGGYLLNRIKKINELQEEIDNSYWVNQYKNPFIYESYKNTLGKEICNEMSSIDYIFIGISSGGTITGVSQQIKEQFPDAKVIAVDVEGSVIFSKNAKKRYIPGIGSSKVPENLKYAHIDDVCIVNEDETIQMCHCLLKEHNIFVGGSSGSVMAAIKKYFKKKSCKNQLDKKQFKIVTIFPDRGDRYVSTIYNGDWCKKILNKISDEHDENKELINSVLL